MAQVQNNEMYKKNFSDYITGTIMNNKKYSDMTFVVNKKQYHACKIVMSAASEVFASLISEHSDNCMDKEVLVTGVKHHESFLKILQYIHGLEINLTLMNKLVLCELLTLTKEYKLDEFHTDLKEYISKVKRFKLNSVVAMLNTAKTYNLVNLYKNLKKYVYQRTEQFLKHRSFDNLKYEVLLDLLGSDLFYSKEIDILRATLNWHDENIIDVEEKEKIDSEMDEEIHLEDNRNIDNDEIDDSLFQTHVAEQFLSKFSDELFYNENDKEHNLDVHNEEGNATSEILSEVQDEEINLEQPNSNVENINEAASNPSATNNIEVDESEATVMAPTSNVNSKTASQVEIFSENVLQMLLKHIRFARIPMFDFLDSMNTGIFNKYRDRILRVQNQMKTNEVPRIVYCDNYRELKFTIRGILDNMRKDESYYSIEKHSGYDFTFQVSAKKRNDTHLGLYLLCQTKQEVWKCDVKYQISLMSYDPYESDNLALKFHYCFSSLEKTIGYGSSNFITFIDLFDPKKHFIQDDTILITVNMKILNDNLE